MFLLAHGVGDSNGSLFPWPKYLFLFHHGAGGWGGGSKRDFIAMAKHCKETFQVLLANLRKVSARGNTVVHIVAMLRLGNVHLHRGRNLCGFGAPVLVQDRIAHRGVWRS